MIHQTEQYKIMKVAQIGGGYTGKSSLYLRYLQGEFIDNPNYIGVEFYTKTIKIAEEQIKFQFWDCHLNEKIYSLYQNYFKQCSIVMISYDITNRYSFDRAQLWCKDYNQKKLNKVALLALIGNKCDLEQQRQVSYQEGKHIAKSLGMLFFEVSSKTGYQVNELFESLISYVININ
ncbi:Ras family small GTPase (macronuclear) [Tetrahymena thermophila SB210]|uniref:Ras family small GTPase n=2 Tax=Tetrahymena thermophila TaxID=5911 RepID=Q22NB2_TETTS|nr:Ras family small GTPase [Tetrahymena thermophila SB210]EAR86873.1 Ras family small GTPase [Tetrahymena thermophila SB210]BAJ21320.1 Rab-family small GTPase RabX1B [Tetrahymena thermophila]|eukprot:XP_001007118.1 Ras family small GTPase [Tetrahymena thermophila SB210]